MQLVQRGSERLRGQTRVDAASDACENEWCTNLPGRRHPDVTMARSRHQCLEIPTTVSMGCANNYQELRPNHNEPAQTPQRTLLKLETGGIDTLDKE